VNYAAQPLQKHEIKVMTEDGTIMRRILMSYKLMLDFYGMRLENEDSGLISRSENYAARYRNLCSTCIFLDLIHFALGWAAVACRALCASLRGPRILSYPSVHLAPDDGAIIEEFAALNRYRVIRSFAYCFSPLLLQ